MVLYHVICFVDKKTAVYREMSCIFYALTHIYRVRKIPQNDTIFQKKKRRLRFSWKSTNDCKRIKVAHI